MAPTSRIDFTPAHTTVIGVRASVPRSADSSHVSRASRCTPPSPPVANTRIPARAASAEVAATVVAPCAPRAAAGGEVARAALDDVLAGRDRLERGVVEPDPDLAVDERDRGRHGARRAHRRLDLAGDARGWRARQPVGDDRALERHHRAARGERVGDLVVDAHRRALYGGVTLVRLPRLRGTCSSLATRPLCSSRSRFCPAARPRCPSRTATTSWAPRCEPPFPDGVETAVFGMGCFWGAERVFWQAPGVYTTAVGYAGGDTPNPTYEEVCSARTGHTEVVLVAFDPPRPPTRRCCEAVLGEPRPDPGHAPGQRRRHAVPLRDLRHRRAAAKAAEASRETVPGAARRRRATARSPPRSPRPGRSTTPRPTTSSTWRRTPTATAGSAAPACPARSAPASTPPPERRHFLARRARTRSAGRGGARASPRAWRS